MQAYESSHTHPPWCVARSRAAENARERILQTAAGSPDDLRTLQQYVSCCEGRLRNELQDALDQVQRMRRTLSHRGGGGQKSESPRRAGEGEEEGEEGEEGDGEEEN